MLTLAQNFAQPAADGVSYQASAGWFNSATALEKWEWSVSLHGNALFIPSDKKTFGLSNSDLELLEIDNIASAELPTAFGANTDILFVGDVTYLNPFTNRLETATVDFKGIDGINRSYVPNAFAQITVGVSAGTEITLRAMPQVTIDGVAASTYGIGAKHNLSQYFGEVYPGDFQLALVASYSKLNVAYEFDPIEVEEGLLTMSMVTVDADLLMTEVIGSKRWNYFELFAALGVMNSSFDYEMGGSGLILPKVNEELVKIGKSQNQFKSDLGFNIYLGRFRLSTMATVGEFFNANLGLSVRI